MQIGKEKTSRIFKKLKQKKRSKSIYEDLGLQIARGKRWNKLQLGEDRQ